jgi:sugar/nucleoside kinase (ribokinase family)
VTTKNYDVFGVGNAIVDILAQVNDATISDLGLNKGGMALMSTEQQGDVLTTIKDPSLTFASGGSAANTMVAIKQSGGTGVYAGKVADDSNGQFYKKDMEAAGIPFYVPMAETGHQTTGSCVVLTTPDAERTMCTHLGISTTLKKSDLDFDLLAQSKCSYIEGYLWDADDPREASIATFEECKKLGIPAAFSFSDPFLVDRYGDQFKDVVRDYCDIIFCNADEAKMFMGVDDVEGCAEKIGAICDLVFITDGGNGCYVIEKGVITKVGGFKVDAVDTVGAGDSFAGGVLYGITNGLSNQQSAKWGNFFASQVVAKFGPRLEQGLESRKSEILG